MGEEIDVERFPPGDYARFANRCREGATALAELLNRPGFGEGPSSLGLELEVGLVGPDARPAPLNAEVRDTAGAGVELELDRFNLEIGTPPAPLAGRPFTALARALEDGLARLRSAAAAHDARIAVIGIVPTLTEGDLALSDSPRFRALSDGLRRLRGGPFRIALEGDEPLTLSSEDVTLEGAATGFHVHLRVAPADFAGAFNAVQAATAPALALGVNSPLLLGHVLWEETRIGLFHQAVDDRARMSDGPLPARVSFGHGWVRRGAAELFLQSALLHAPVLPVLGDEDPRERVRAGAVPALSELRMHHGTVYRWNRAVYEPGDDPHLRIEMRALPGGPTVTDMAANAALLTGSALALAARADWLTCALPFELARRNFYAAARTGLEATLLWPCDDPPSPRARPVREVLEELIPAAAEALVDAGVEREEAERLLEVAERRMASGATGAAWQRSRLRRLEERLPRERALAAMTEEYLALSAAGEPVHLWDAPGR